MAWYDVCRFSPTTRGRDPEIDAKEYRDFWAKRRDADGKRLRRPKPGYHSAAIYPNGTRSGRSHTLSAHELQTLREEAQLAKETRVPGQQRGPVIKPGEKPGFWRGQAWREGRMGGGKRFGNRGGRHRLWYKDQARRGKLRPTPGKLHSDYAASRAWHNDRAGKVSQNWQ